MVETKRVQQGASSRVQLKARSWLVDQAIEHSDTIAKVVGAGLVTWFSSFVAFIRPLGAFGWSAVAILTYLLLSIGYWLSSVARRTYAETKFAERRADALDVNPLDHVFSRKRIKLTDFFHPYFKPIQLARFDDCEMLGPSAIAILNCTLDSCAFNNCEAVIVRADARIVGATAFERCTFHRCQFFGVTLLMTKETYLKFSSHIAGDKIRVISDGTAGLL